MKKVFSGSIVALVTPFDRKGKVDKSSLEKLVSWHVKEGTDGIVCVGSTGEALTLSEKEKLSVLEVCLKTAQKKIPVLMGTGSSSTKETVLLTEKAKKKGADGALVVTPFYNKPSQRGLTFHFQEVAKVGLPLILYNNPSRAAVRLEAQTIAILGQDPFIVGIKESSHDLELVRETRKLSSIPILSGEDDLTLEILREGGIGAISVVGNLIPNFFKKMVHLGLKGQFPLAEKMCEKIYPLSKTLFLETNPQGVKFALEWMGKCLGLLRLPLHEVSEKTKEQICKKIIQLGLPWFDFSKVRL